MENIRLEFAKAALTGIVSTFDERGWQGDGLDDTIARRAFQIADAMLREMEKSPDGKSDDDGGEWGGVIKN